MSRTPQSGRLTSGFNLGGQQAEADPFLEDAFYDTALYRAINSRADGTAFIVGRTGSGKSALLNRLEHDHDGHVVRINPQDLSLPYITDSTVIRSLKAEGVHLDPLFIALWKHVLVVEIIRHRYGINTAEAKQTFMTTLLDKLKRDRSKTEALKYLDDFQTRFWCEADVRVREITDTFEERVNNVGNVGLKQPLPVDLNASRQGTTTHRTERREEWVSKVQRIVNETQLARLNQMIRVIDEDIIESPQNYTYIVIDDLDQDWVDDAVLNDLIRCLFRAVVELKRVRNLKIIVALRTNIFESLDFGVRTGGQEEKFRAITAHVRWSAADLERMLEERIQVAAAQYNSELTSLSELLPSTNPTRGSAIEYIFERTLMRPRDAIAYFNFALEQATNRPRLTWEKIHDAEPQYSHNRLLALRDEWKPTFPGIDEIFAKFSKAPRIISRNELTDILLEIALLIAEPSFDGTTWLTPMCDRLWDYNDHSWAEEYGNLLRLLYDVGFLGCRLGSGEVCYKYTSPDLLLQDSAVDIVSAATVHPAFRLALDIAAN